MNANAVLGNTTGYTRIHNPRAIQGLRGTWLIAATAAIVFVIISIPYFLQDCGCPAPVVTEWERLGVAQIARTLFTFTNIITFTFFMSISALLFYRRGDDWMSVLVAFSFTLLAGGLFSSPAISYSTLYVKSVYAQLDIGALCLFAVLFRYPDGKAIFRWTNPALVIFGVYVALLLIFEKPFDSIWVLALLIMGVLACFTLVQRYRFHANPLQRQQMKWLVIACIAMVATIPASVLAYILPDPTERAIALLIAHLISSFAFIWIPVSVAFAIFRFRLWDVDLAINRSLVAAAVTVLVALSFVVAFEVGNVTLQSVIGTSQPGLAGAIAAAVAVALYRPVNQRARRVVDQRVFGFRFDLRAVERAQLPPAITNPGALSGKQLDEYLILDLVGQGGMGEVYKGQANGVWAAIKVLREDVSEKPEFRARFDREVKVMATLIHPHIVRLFGHGQSSGVSYIAMEYIEGDPLDKRIIPEKLPPLAEVRQLITGLATALDYAHEQGIIHRDIKPSNVMLRHSESSSPVLMDFGIAKLQEGQTRFTGTAAIGTIGYMSPEQIMSAREVDHRADIYALGVVCYELVTGRRPFEGSAGQVVFAHIQQPPPDPSTFNPSLPRSVSSAILRALAKNTEDRWSTAGAFAQALSADAKS